MPPFYLIFILKVGGTRNVQVEIGGCDHVISYGFYWFNVIGN